VAQAALFFRGGRARRILKKVSKRAGFGAGCWLGLWILLGLLLGFTEYWAFAGLAQTLDR
jgi:hypothetical protein